MPTYHGTQVSRAQMCQGSTYVQGPNMSGPKRHLGQNVLLPNMSRENCRYKCEDMTPLTNIRKVRGCVEVQENYIIAIIGKGQMISK